MALLACGAILAGCASSEPESGGSQRTYTYETETGHEFEASEPRPGGQTGVGLGNLDCGPTESFDFVGPATGVEVTYYDSADAAIEALASQEGFARAVRRSESERAVEYGLVLEDGRFVEIRLVEMSPDGWQPTDWERCL